MELSSEKGRNGGDTISSRSLLKRDLQGRIRRSTEENKGGEKQEESARFGARGGRKPTLLQGALLTGGSTSKKIQNESFLRTNGSEWCDKTTRFGRRRAVAG